MLESPRHENIVISVPGKGSAKPFTCLMLNCIPDLNLNDASGQCFPLYFYGKIDDGKQNNNGWLFEKHDPDGYIRRDAIADWALSKFRKHFGRANQRPRAGSQGSLPNRENDFFEEREGYRQEHAGTLEEETAFNCR